MPPGRCATLRVRCVSEQLAPWRKDVWRPAVRALIIVSAGGTGTVHQEKNLNPDAVTQKRRNWTTVWAQGHLTSCIGAFDDNYEGPIRDFWREFFGAMPKGARVLDVATGNGAVALIAAQLSDERGLGLEVHGIDLADIDPPANVPLHRAVLETIHFHPRVSAEDTGFEDAWFQGIASQYGVEYADLAATFPELFRVLAPGGSLCLIIHHADSLISRTSRAELADARVLTDETELFGKAQALMEYVDAAGSPEARRALAQDPEAERRREAFNAAAARVDAARRASSGSEFLDTALNYIAEAWRTLQRGQARTALAQLATGRQLLDANVDRLEDLLAAAQDGAQMGEIQAQMAAAGFQGIQVGEIHHDADRLMGWKLMARRPQ